MARILRWLVVVFTTVLVSFLTFWLLVHLLRPGWNSSEYSAIAVWTIPLGVLILMIAKFLRRWIRHWHAIARAVALVLSAVLAAVVWTELAIVLTGGYALAFDANPLWCWTAASIAGMSVALFWPNGNQVQAPLGEAAL
jgi:hypothetical protein